MLGKFLPLQADSFPSSSACDGRSESVSPASILLGDVLSMEVSGSNRDNSVAMRNSICQY